MSSDLKRYQFSNSSQARLSLVLSLPVITRNRDDVRMQPHKTRPMTALLLFTGLNIVLVSTIAPVYEFVCFLPYWERRRERRRHEREAASIDRSI